MERSSTFLLPGNPDSKQMVLKEERPALTAGRFSNWLKFTAVSMPAVDDGIHMPRRGSSS
jgi:hypothetical protein